MVASCKTKNTLRLGQPDPRETDAHTRKPHLMEKTHQNRLQNRTKAAKDSGISSIRSYPPNWVGAFPPARSKFQTPADSIQRIGTMFSVPLGNLPSRLFRQKQTLQKTNKPSVQPQI
ncbi:MAG: hypothetical protein EBS01_06015 [Verrucomicrobia bacterium]|nr:hypothetical protein [Verrucomicrobiota bacterium]